MSTYRLVVEISGISWHSALALAAVVLGPVGCLVSLGYTLRVDRRDAWRRPMLVTAVLGAGAILAAYVSGVRDLQADDGPAAFEVADHREYALRLLLPTVCWLVMALLTGWLDPRTGALRLMLPLLLSGFAVVVLVLVVLVGDPETRSVWERLGDAV